MFIGPRHSCPVFPILFSSHPFGGKVFGMAWKGLPPHGERWGFAKERLKRTGLRKDENNQKVHPTRTQPHGTQSHSETCGQIVHVSFCCSNPTDSVHCSSHCQIFSHDQVDNFCQ